MTETFSAVLWEHDGSMAWHFVTLPPELADDVREVGAGARAGFGSVRVTATIGGTTWQTSLFPEARTRSYVLPVKKPVRTAEGLRAGDRVQVQLVVTLDPAPRTGGGPPTRSGR
ncbi:DUF1905 domain-containing protein [Blastococcus sp. TBT05-19]|uniref:DUF1905 domain-containing protein n=1 Tax=Blastococcus sp. TBT05-19 TaxID=2250581 RepID=UPI000DEAEE94|nr:DUF1905 domain-containing protein [Blastococcus sp. TBT05-19]RBY94161.1 DUF1905 domain-containing protein [Blastococcus sp. TBT05-19]